MDLIIFCGQSNMQGQSEVLSETEVVDRALEYRLLSDEFIPLRNPVGENIKYDYTEGFECISGEEWRAAHFAGSSWMGHTNLVPSFCRAYIKETDREVIAVHVAKGHTTVDYWSKGNKGYEILLKKVKAAISKAENEHNIEEIFFVWLQGESDAIFSSSKEYYKKKITTLCQNLKKDFGISKFGVIRVGRFMEDERDDEIINAQNEVCNENSDFLMLCEKATELNKSDYGMNPDVKGHYSAKGLEILGTESGKALGRYRINLF